MKHGNSETGAIGIHLENPHYFSYKGKPVLLITSAEHYGAVVNNGFDYIAYFDTLKRYQLNYTRIYTGAYTETKNQVIEGNTLGLTPGDAILPWPRSAQTGCGDGGNKYDLNRWNEAYFLRLKDFISEAYTRDIIVEVCLFNCQYPESWAICPFHAPNNIQGIGNCGHNDAQTTLYKDVLAVQKDYVRKIVEEVNEFDNIILEICDEPTLIGTPDELATQWINQLADEIIQTENGLPKKHLLAQQIEGRVDFAEDVRIQIITTQYIWEAYAQQLGGMQALECKYALNKPIELNETYYFPAWYIGDIVSSSRVEAWEFIVGGGAAFNHLNGVFTVENPGGDTPDNDQLLASFKNLIEFMYSFDFATMRKDTTFIKGGVPNGVFCRGISQPGRQYALYLHHSSYWDKNNLGSRESYCVTPGSYQDKLILNIPPGSYQVEWINPASGEVISSQTVCHNGSQREFATPVYSVDIALRMKAVLP